MINKYLIILYFIWCFILTGCVTEQPIATPTVQHLTAPQIKNYVCTGEYDLKRNIGEPFTVDAEGNFYITNSTIDYRMNIKKYNSQGKYIITWIPEIKKRKLNCWFVKRKYGPGEEYLSDIFADKENIYLAYGAAYEYFRDECCFIDYTGHIEKFDLNGNFITAIKPEKDSFPRDFVRYITKDKNGNFYLASRKHIEKYDTNLKLQSILYPFAKKWYKKTSNFPNIALIGDLAIDSGGYIYILLKWWWNDNNGYIAKFDSSGKLIKKWITEDKDEFDFCALEIDPDDNIYVLAVDKSDTYHIQQFDSSGNFITGWKPGYNGDHYNTTYTDMKIDSKGNIYVDTGKGTIKKFSPKQ
jgi:hypothetical protein